MSETPTYSNCSVLNFMTKKVFLGFSYFVGIQIKKITKNMFITKAIKANIKKEISQENF